MASPIADGAPYSPPYTPDMAKRLMLPIQEFRARLSERLKAGEKEGGGEHTVLNKHGRPVGVYVPIAWYREACEKLNDPTEF